MSAMGKLLIFPMICFTIYLFMILLKFLYKYWWKPVSIQNLLNSQGIKGPAYRFIHGNNKEATELKKIALKPMADITNDIFPKVMPHVNIWINIYGKNYLSWDGIRGQLVITDPELVKEVLKSGEKVFPKRKPPIFSRRLLGDGLVTTTGEKWAKQRKLANHVFHGDSLKNMSPAVIASVESMLERWKGQEGKEMEIFEEFRILTSEMISRTAFGSSYLEGKKIFNMLMKLSVIVSQNAFKTRIPGISKFWRSSDDIESMKLEKGIYDSVMEIVKRRENKVASGEADNFGSDFLGLLIKAHHSSDKKNRFSEQDLVDECKTFYFAGQETTNSLLAWTVLMLAIHRDWQQKARTEVIELFGNKIPDSEGMAKLKVLNMIMYETLRLYAPVNGLARKVERQVQLGKLVLPAGLEFMIPNMALHHDPLLWGDDALLFKPERFAEGIAKATRFNAAAYIPFGLGPRSCVGMSFATIETKAAISMILQRYIITLSPTYVHSPIMVVTLKPQHGIQVILQSLHTSA